MSIFFSLPIFIFTNNWCKKLLFLSYLVQFGGGFRWHPSAVRTSAGEQKVFVETSSLNDHGKGFRSQEPGCVVSHVMCEPSAPQVRISDSLLILLNAASHPLLCLSMRLFFFEGRGSMRIYDFYIFSKRSPSLLWTLCMCRTPFGCDWCLNTFMYNTRCIFVLRRQKHVRCTSSA